MGRPPVPRARPSLALFIDDRFRLNVRDYERAAPVVRHLDARLLESEAGSHKGRHLEDLEVFPVGGAEDQLLLFVVDADVVRFLLFGGVCFYVGECMRGGVKVGICVTAGAIAQTGGCVSSCSCGLWCYRSETCALCKVTLITP